MVDAPKLVNFSKSDLEIHSNACRFPTKRDKKRDEASASSLLLGDSLGARTQDPNIKSVVLYQLS